MADHYDDKMTTPENEKTAESHIGEKGNAAEHVEGLENIDLSDGSSENLHKKAGIAVIRQQHTIPATGDRMTTSKWEYIFFCVFCKPTYVLQSFGVLIMMSRLLPQRRSYVISTVLYSMEGHTNVKQQSEATEER